MSNSIKLGIGYTNTDSTRQITIGDVADSICAAPATVKSKIQAINASLAAGTDGGLSDFFRADDYDAVQSIGSFNQIKSATIVESEVTNVVISGGE